MTDALLPRQAAEPAGDGYFRKVEGSLASPGRVGCVHSGLCARGSASRGRLGAGVPCRSLTICFLPAERGGLCPMAAHGRGEQP